jgi:hypothetical protein
MALLGIICLIFIEYMLIFGLGGMLLPLGLALPLVALFACGSYMAAFASYYKIKEIMIDPYVSETNEEEFTDFI